MTDPDPTTPRPDPYASAPNPYSRETPAAALRAPEGTDPYTLWIWLIVALPVVQTLPIFFIDWSSFIDASLADPTGLGAYSVLFSPAYLVLIAFGWIGTGLMFWFAYLDWRELQRRGVPQPFHWAWIFLTLAVSYAVYTIGRSVVVKRRTGRGSAPMWITIATIVAGFGVGIWITVVIFQGLFDVLSTTSFGP
ncbi:hypothetical protein [Microcella sp.]|uniref:hypothetical protein n=1 Tax=Microcella sp. TaxID=1913979 RepID=UPI002560EEC5|nr:hypothetical protein [Microcella sp.]MBX9473077.1 hypothetical protein [Microcella sp.]